MEQIDYISQLNESNFHSISLDSVQQRKALLGKNSYLNYFRLKAVLKLQILLTGRIVLTDAQVYDGLFFFWMANEKEFDDFLRCGAEEDFLQIRVRDHQVFPTSMFLTPFVCSAIELKGLSDAIYRITSDMFRETAINTSNEKTKELLVSRSIKGDKDSPDEYINEAENRLKKLYKNAYGNEWERYKDSLQIIYDSIKEHRKIIETWEKDKIFMNEDDCEKIQEVLSMVIEKENNQHYCNTIFCQMTAELTQRRCKRSGFVNQCEQLLKKCNDNKNAMEAIQELLQTFDKYYNQSIARNIKCGTIFEISEFNDASPASLDALQISKQLLWNLANMKWDEFQDLYEQSKALDTLEERLTYISNYSFKDYGTSKSIPENGPWNYQNTFDYSNAKIKVEDMQFIDAKGNDTDRMYIWCSDWKDDYYLERQLEII